MDDIRAMLRVEGLPKIQVRTLHTNEGTSISYRIRNVRRKVHGSTRGMTAEDKFMLRVERKDMGYETECLLWTGYIDKDGYGKFSTAGKNHGAHRWAFEHWVRKLEPGEVPDHECLIRHCVNWEHMEAVTNAENVRRGYQRRGVLFDEKTHCKHEHALTPENVYTNPQGRKSCRTCTRIATKQWQDHERRMREPVVAEPRTHCNNAHDLSVFGEYIDPRGKPQGCNECRRLAKVRQKERFSIAALMNEFQL